MKIYNYSKQKITKLDLKEVNKSLLRNSLSRGPTINIFEKKLKLFTKSKYAIAVNNGTSALILAVNSLKLKKNSLIAVPNITFIATANAPLLAGHRVVLLDVNKDTGLVELKSIKKQFYKSKIDCFINVHLNGNIGELKDIFNFCKSKKIRVIDDACHALGTEYKINKKAYNICDNKYCDISTLSFHPTKLITTGEGGAFLTNDNEINDRARKIMNHGYEKSFIQSGNYKHSYYKIVTPGYNFRISDINCSLGIGQINNIKNKISHRRKIALFYDNYFKDNEYVDTLIIDKNIKSAYHLYPIFIKSLNKINKIELMKKLEKKKIFTQIHYLPLNRQPLLKKTNKLFLQSQIYFEKSLSIPMHEGISISDAKYISKTIINEIKKIKKN